jgi:hypothetical protein
VFIDTPALTLKVKNTIPNVTIYLSEDYLYPAKNISVGPGPVDTTFNYLYTSAPHFVIWADDGNAVTVKYSYEDAVTFCIEAGR